MSFRERMTINITVKNAVFHNATILEKIYDWTDWGSYSMVTNFWIPLVATIFAILFGSFVILQFHSQKRQLEVQIKETERRNVLDTFKVVDKYREEIFHKHDVIDVLLGEIPLESKYPFVEDSLDDVEELLDDIEVLALKKDELGLKMRVIYDLVGNMIIGVYDNDISKDVIKRCKEEDSDIYENLITFVDDLKNLKQKNK